MELSRDCGVVLSVPFGIACIDELDRGVGGEEDGGDEGAAKKGRSEFFNLVPIQSYFRCVRPLTRVSPTVAVLEFVVTVATAGER